MADGSVQLVSARPTIRVGEQAFPLLSANITRMRMTEAAGGLSSIEITFTDWLSHPDGTAGYGATSGSPLKLGAKIKVYAGATSQPQEIFSGMITAIEGEVGGSSPPTFTILAEDGLWKARKTRRTRTFEDAAPADIARRIAQDHGLTPEIRDGLDQPVRDWAQMNESDLAFLRRVLLAYDADVQIVGDKLQAGPLARDRRTAVTLRLGGGLLRARVTADLADQATEVRVSSFDPETGEAVTATATAGELGAGAGAQGPAAVREAMGEAREHVGSAGPLTQSDADKLARALYGQRARRFVRVDATAQGDASLRVGSWVTLAGINPFFQNDYVVTQAIHRFDLASGYVTDLLAEGAYLGSPA